MFRTAFLLHQQGNKICHKHTQKYHQMYLLKGHSGRGELTPVANMT